MEKKMMENVNGKPGEFDFLSGEWKVHHRRLKNPINGEWDSFDCEATCWSILGGNGSVLLEPRRSIGMLNLPATNRANFIRQQQN